MKNLKMKKLLVALLTVLILTMMASKVFALSLPDLVEKNPNNIILQGNSLEEDTPTPTTPSTTNTTTNTIQSGDSKLPQTGDASDYAIFAIIGVCLIVSVYAYKKVKDYNKI